MKTVIMLLLGMLTLGTGACDDDGGSSNNGFNNTLNNNNNTTLNNDTTQNNSTNNANIGTLGYACDNGICTDGSSCIADLCTAAGHAGEPCYTDGTCAEGIVCHEGICYDAGDEEEMCLPNNSCSEGLSCFEDFCYLAGGDGEPCFPDDTCNEGFACANESVESSEECRPAIMGRVVNCLSSGGQSIDLQLVVGMVEFPAIPSMYSTECQPIPTGGVGVTMYVDGEWYEDGFMQITDENPEVYFQPGVSSVAMYVAACDAQLQCQ